MSSDAPPKTAAFVCAATQLCATGDVDGRIDIAPMLIPARVQERGSSGSGAARAQAETHTLTLHTSDGSAVSCLLTVDLLRARRGHRLGRLESAASGGLAVGTASGTVVYFQGSRAVCKHCLSQTVSALARHRSSDGVPCVVAGDVGGNVVAFNVLASLPLFRLRLVDTPQLLASWRMGTPAVCGLTSCRVAGGRRETCLLVATDTGALVRVGADGRPAHLVESAVEVTAVASGEVMEDDDDDDDSDDEREDEVESAAAAADEGELEGEEEARQRDKRQRLDASLNAAPAASPLSTVLLACADGVLRLLSDLASVAVVGARVSSLDARDWHGGGLVACCGQFEGVLVATRAGYMLQPTT